ncbi:MAG: hypothetical protein A2606_03505 [Candidatus Yanofskybacteria bacterium RIFOXYD1_FULL_42_10]|uniref:Uncharacterized protein n=1 Tax=Candidatus Yanofskybacteria bacterium RIFOXYD1_FULL_42_10 TaxID=1802718 RepID=A0A1F8HSE5_9BACT|nr:MAG: hypothetical protein A2606_03505 [Candidatus Yanofskybacteria bacterium RIFOXYD1_FULL_42_10]
MQEKFAIFCKNCILTPQQFFLWRQILKTSEDVLKKAQQILAKRKERENVKKRVEEEKRKFTEEINAVKKAREAELHQYAREIWQWVNQFLITDEAAVIFSALNPILLFTARFWQGAPVNSQSEHASMSLKVESFYSSQIGVLIYEEHSKQWSSGHQDCYNPADLVNNLHPDFLKQFAEALKNGVVWEKIDQDLSRFIH